MCPGENHTQVCHITGIVQVLSINSLSHANSETQADEAWVSSFLLSYFLIFLTGSWHDPSTSGQGLLLHSMSDEQVVVSFYGYNNDSERMWLIGLYTGQVAWDKPLEFVMTTASGGRFGGFTPEDITENSWGTLTINFADCQNAIASLNGTDGQQMMNMGKLAGLQGSDFDCH